MNRKKDTAEFLHLVIHLMNLRSSTVDLEFEFLVDCSKHIDKDGNCQALERSKERSAARE